jgi:hypothetical protein
MYLIETIDMNSSIVNQKYKRLDLVDVGCHAEKMCEDMSLLRHMLEVVELNNVVQVLAYNLEVESSDKLNDVLHIWSLKVKNGNMI